MSDNIGKNNISDDFSTDFDLEKNAKLNLGNKNKPHNFPDKYLSTGKYKSSGMEYQDKYLSEFPDEIATKNSERDFNSEHLPKFGEEKKENLDITDQIEESDNTAEDEVMEENAENQPDTTEDIVENIEDANEANEVNEDIESSVEQANEQNEEINEQNETPAEQNETDTETPEPTEFDQVRQQWEERLARQNAPQNILTRGWNWMKRNHIHKIGLGFGAAGLAFFAPVAGTVGLIAVPVAYGLGLKYGIEGVTEFIQRKFCNGDKLKNNLSGVEKDIETKLSILKSLEENSIDKKIIDKLKLEITSLNQSFRKQEAVYNQWSTKHELIRSAFGTIGSLTTMAITGVPLGFQVFKGSGHVVFWSAKHGLSFLYNAATDFNSIATTFTWANQTAHTLTSGIPLLSNVLWRVGLFGTALGTCVDTGAKLIKYYSKSTDKRDKVEESETPLDSMNKVNEQMNKNITSEEETKHENSKDSSEKSAKSEKEKIIRVINENPVNVGDIKDIPKTETTQTDTELINNEEKKEAEKSPSILQNEQTESINEKKENVTEKAFDSGYDEIDNFVQNISNLRNPAVDRKELVTECYLENEGGILDSIKNRITKELEKKLSNNSTFDFVQYQNEWKNAFTHLKRDNLWQETIKQANESDSPLLQIFAKPEMLSLTPTQFPEIDNLRYKVNILKHLGHTSEIDTLISSDNDLSQEIANSCMHDFYDISSMDDEQIEELKQELQAKKHRVNRFKEAFRKSFATEFFPDYLQIAEDKLKEYYFQNARKNEVFKKFVYHNLIDWQMTGLKELDNFVIRSHAYQYAAEKKNDKLTVTARNTATQAILKMIEDDQEKATRFLSKNLVETFRLIRQKDRDHIAKSIIEFVSKEQSISQVEGNKMIDMVKDAIRQDDDRREDKDKKDNYTIDKIML